jgi:hypothetical protein
MTKRLSIPRKAKRGRPASLSDDDLLMAALWMKHLAVRPVAKQSDHALATALRNCRDPAVRTLLGTSSQGTLRNRLRKLRGEISDPYWEFLVLVAEWAKENGLSFRPLEELQDTKRLPRVTSEQFRLAIRGMMIVRMLRHRLEPAEFELVMRHWSGED